jgi:myosin heavy subunit
MEQLTYAGVFEAVAIRKTGYPFRLTHCRFANRYRCLAYKPGGWVPLKVRSTDHRAMCSALLQCVNQDFSAVQIGVTMVLYRCVCIESLLLLLREPNC